MTHFPVPGSPSTGQRPPWWADDIGNRLSSTANGRPRHTPRTSRQDKYWHAQMDVDNAGSDVYEEFQIVGVAALLERLARLV